MARAEIEVLIRRNRNLYQELHEIHLERLKIEEEFLFKNENEQLELNNKIKKNEDLENEKESKIKRARKFGLVHGKHNKPVYCMSCYIENGSELPLVESDSSLGNGIKSYKCEKCNYVVEIEPF